MANHAVLNSALVNYLKTDRLEAELAKIDHLDADSAFIKYLEANLITASKIDVKELTAKLAAIDVANIGGAFIDSLQSLSSHIVTSVVNNEYVKRLVANYISVADLKAGDITLSDEMRILSENGNLILNGSLLQILGKDAEGKDYIGIQMGYGNDDKPSLIIRDENGASILTSQGITSNAIPDGLIVDDMVADGSLSKDKLSFPIVEPNAQGGVDITQIYDGEGGNFGIDYTSFKTATQQNLKDMDSIKKELATNTEEISGLKTVADTTTQAITNKIWKTEIETAVDAYDKETVQKISERVTETKESLDGLSTTVSSLNTTTTELDSKVEAALSKAEQTSDKFSWLVKSGTSASDFSITDRLIALTSAALNINALTTFMNSAKNGSSTVIDGGSIKTDSITADQLRINSLDAIAALIGGFHIRKSSLYSGEKSSIANTSQGIYMDSSGQFNIGDGKNYFKYYKDTNDNYKLDVTAENIRFGATNENLKDVKEQITDPMPLKK